MRRPSRRPLALVPPSLSDLDALILERSPGDPLLRHRRFRYRRMWPLVAHPHGVADRSGFAPRGDVGRAALCHRRVMTLPPLPAMRILIVDDDPVIRSALRLLLGFERGLTVVGEASDTRDAIDRCNMHEVDIVLMDVRMRGMDGIAATTTITGRGAHPPAVILLATFEGPGLEARAAAAGASGVILKRDAPDALLVAIRNVAEARRRARTDPREEP